MDNEELKKIFNFDWKLPIAFDGEIWNGRPGKWSNIKNRSIQMSQRFGMNLMDYKQFGMKGHNGVDIAGRVHTKIVAPSRMWGAQVIPEDKDKGYGNSIWTESETIKLNGESYKLQLVFGHFDSIKISSGNWIEAGSILGDMGSTGFSSGSHLHFGIRPWNSKDGDNWKQTYSNNGYKGYIDPEILLPHIVWDWQELINLDKFMATSEKKLIVEGEGFGRKGIMINGKLREVKHDRAAEACFYVLANNGFGKTIDTKAFDDLPREKDF